MARQHPGREIAQFKPKTSQLEAQVQAIAADSAKVNWSNHALDRMEERGISTLDALRVLRAGDIRGEIEPGRAPGEWKCKMVARKQGSREIGVVTVTLNSGRLFVKTVE